MILKVRSLRGNAGLKLRANINRHPANVVDRQCLHFPNTTIDRDTDVYVEGGSFNFLALTVQARLSKYVGAKSTQDPRQIKERDRIYWTTPFVPSGIVSTSHSTAL
jgi:hypothetical protein